jgi:hypothetical protein
MNPVKKAIQMLRHAISRIVGGIQPTNLKGNYDDQPPVVSEGSNQAASPALSPSTRAQDVRRFYELLDRLAARIGGPRTFGAVDRRVDWPHRGVYFFFEPGEVRSGSGNGPRVVRVGTHALRVDSRSSLWGRLSEHRGTPTGGNHRGSVFRLLVGLALQSHDPRLRVGSWAKGASASGSIVEGERELEAKVSAVMGKMQLLWLPVEDEPGPRSLRSFIERNALALLSAYRSEEIDPPSSGWLARIIQPIDYFSTQKVGLA